MLQAYTNATIFTGEKFMHNRVVIVKDDIIEVVIPASEVPEAVQVIDCTQQLLVPAFIDLQIYGAKGRLFSAYPSVEALELLAIHNAAGGTATCLVTIATQPVETIYTCIDVIKEYWRQGKNGMMGMHLEGPYINAVKRGAHKEEWIHAPTIDEVSELLAYSDGVIKMVTLAPEILDGKIIQLFRDHGVIVSIGHSNATFKEATDSLNNGVGTVTHLFNAMSALHHREPGLAGAAMLHPTATASIIPDGIHIAYETLQIAKKMMGERLFFITDAVTETNVGPYRHVLNTDHYDLPNGTLSGSALTMIDGIRNAVEHCNISLEEALRMASLYPAKVMEMDGRWGRIEKGHVAQFALVSEDLSSAKSF